MSIELWLPGPPSGGPNRQPNLLVDQYGTEDLLATYSAEASRPLASALAALDVDMGLSAAAPVMRFMPVKVVTVDTAAAIRHYVNSWRPGTGDASVSLAIISRKAD